MISCNTFLSINGQSHVECLPITENNTVSLCKNGVTSHDSAIASLQLDEHNELVVVKLAETPVTLERAGRKMALRADKPIRICEKDTLWIDNTSIEIVKSTFVISKSAPKSALIQTARKVIAASAAVFSMAAFAACEEDGCEDGQQKCKNDSVYICAKGSWSLLEKCGDEEICKEADNSTAYCSFNGLTGDVRPVEVCRADEMKCDNNNVYKCDGNDWKLEKKCGAASECVQKSNTSAICDSSSLDGGFPVNECDDNEMKCDNNNVYKCDENGLWTLSEECGDVGCYQSSNTSAYCNYEPEAGVLPAPTQCEPDEMKCMDNVIYKCSDGMWEKSQECKSDEQCVQMSNTSAICEVEPLAGEPLPPDIPTPEPVQPPEDDA